VQSVIATMLIDRGAFMTGAFKLKLHETKPDAPLSPIYINFRNKDNPKPGPLQDRDYDLMALCLLDMIKESSIEYDGMAGIPRAGVPFIDGIRRVVCADRADSDWGFRIIPLDKMETAEGRCIIPKAGFKYRPGERVIVIDDLVTEAHTKLEAIRAIEAGGAIVVGLFVMLDREQGGRKIIEDAGYKLFSAFTITELLQYYLEAEKITREKYDEIIAYISTN